MEPKKARPSKPSIKSRGTIKARSAKSNALQKELAKVEQQQQALDKKRQQLEALQKEQEKTTAIPEGVINKILEANFQGDLKKTKCFLIDSNSKASNTLPKFNNKYYIQRGYINRSDAVSHLTSRTQKIISDTKSVNLIKELLRQWAIKTILKK